MGKPNVCVRIICYAICVIIAAAEHLREILISASLALLFIAAYLTAIDLLTAAVVVLAIASFTLVGGTMCKER